MSQKYEKLKTLLKELFQLDQPDLEKFGVAESVVGCRGSICWPQSPAVNR